MLCIVIAINKLYSNNFYYLTWEVYIINKYCKVLLLIRGFATFLTYPCTFLWSHSFIYLIFIKNTSSLTSPDNVVDQPASYAQKCRSTNSYGYYFSVGQIILFFNMHTFCIIHGQATSFKQLGPNSAWNGMIVRISVIENCLKNGGGRLHICISSYQ